eukprot:GDKJ01012382.1.p1 GENE.GDKJ01012382.1~~GDKJ01012382.1.p1  ORF type:complete len:542 (-),score=138.69 GDKJ01012382.1:930-2555(-)
MDWKSLDFKKLTTNELELIKVETPPQAGKAIAASAHSKIILEVLRSTDYNKTLELIRIMHDIITNDLKEVTDKSITNAKFQSKLREIIMKFPDNDVKYIESICNLYIDRTDVGADLSEKIPEYFRNVEDKVSVKRLMHTLAHTMTTVVDYDLHMLVVETLNESPEIFSAHFQSVLEFWVDGDFMSFRFMRHKTIWQCFCRVLLLRIKELFELPASKDFLRKPEVIKVLHVLHYVSVTDFAPPEEEEEDEEEEYKTEKSDDLLEDEAFISDPRGLLLKYRECENENSEDLLFKFFKRGLSCLTNREVECDETAGGPSLLAALGFFSSIARVRAFRLGIFDTLVERIMSSHGNAKFVVDSVDSASIVHVLSEFFSILVPETDSKFVALLKEYGLDASDEHEQDLVENKVKVKRQPMDACGVFPEDKEFETFVRSEVVRKLLKPTPAIVKAFALACKNLRDNFDGTIKVTLLLATLSLVELSADEIRNEEAVGAGGFLRVMRVDKASLKILMEKTESVIPETEYEVKLKDLANVAVDALSVGAI